MNNATTTLAPATTTTPATATTPEITNTTSIGVICYFRGRSIWIKPAEARAMLAGHSVSKKVPDLRPVAAKRAVTAAKRFSGTRVRVLCATSRVSKWTAMLTFSVLHKQVEPGRKAEWREADTVTWSYSGGWSSANNLSASLEFIDYAKTWQTHLDYGWIKGLADKMLRDVESIPLPGGGVRFVTQDNYEDFTSHQKIIEQIPGARLVAIRVDGSDEETRRDIANAAQDDLASQIADTLQQLEDWKETSQRRGSTLESMLQGLVSLRGRAKALAIALSFKADELESQLDEVDGFLKAEMDALPVKPARSATPRGNKVAGGAIVASIIAGFEGLGADDGRQVRLKDLIARIEAQGSLVASGKTPVRILVSGRIAALVRHGDPRFVKAAPGVYSYNPTPAATEPAETQEALDPNEVTAPPVEEFELLGPDVEATTIVDFTVIPDVDSLSDEDLAAYGKAHGIRTTNLDLIASELADMREAAGLA